VHPNFYFLVGAEKLIPVLYKLKNESNALRYNTVREIANDSKPAAT
jgi:hypothetical protein